MADWHVWTDDELAPLRARDLVHYPLRLVSITARAYCFRSMRRRINATASSCGVAPAALIWS